MSEAQAGMSEVLTMRGRGRLTATSNCGRGGDMGERSERISRFSAGTRGDAERGEVAA
ncbi:hypothetical protein [Plantactinospora soyae]|uniref:Uncharacterized protein n=1 Tax=Plantactinospora soyae TaxID=1544732 RepID=A0A927M1B3_9ACTN|nr:hypothetical protein [Plantactinospora soyae]MBE1484977.1 hypothetical protein [Plantactinospora soyae]